MFLFAAEGRILVLGIYLGMLSTVGSAIFAANFYCDYFFSISTDTNAFPQLLYQETEKFKEIVNYASAFGCIFVSLFMLYVCV
jgi:hypothetical protein